MSSLKLQVPNEEESNFSDSMSDFMETSHSWLSQKLSQEGKKAKKKHKVQNSSMEKAESTPKKKKKSKNKEGSAEKMAKKKVKKKKRKKSRESLDEAKTLLTSTPRSHDKLRPDHLTPGSKKKSKRDKMEFGPLPCPHKIKRPKFASLPPPDPPEAVPSEPPSPPPPPAQCGDGASCLEPTQPGSNSQCPSEDSCSQDLFITQRTFRASPTKPSSGECSVSFASPQRFLQSNRKKLHLLESPPRQCSSKMAVEANKPSTALGTVKSKLKKGKLVFLSELTSDRCSVVNPHLSEPPGCSPSPCLVKSQKPSHPSRPQSVRSCSTQTENLTSYLHFCQEAKMAELPEDIGPVDLSLPDRARKDLRTSLSAKMSSPPGQVKGEDRRNRRLLPSATEEVKEDLSPPSEYCENAKSKDETTESSQSESDPRSADASNSSEDAESHRHSNKLRMAQQGRAVQTRLNESFFFKTKGAKDGLQPRSKSQLMQPSQSGDVTSKKRH